MENKAPYALVGLFVCLCIAGLTGFLIWSQGEHEKDLRTYTVLMPDTVSGLEVGGQVLYRGIRVGKVEAMRLPPAGDSDVRVDIRIRGDVPVRASSRAELGRTSLTGIAGLNLVAPQPKDEKAPQYLAGEPYPIIQGRKSALDNALRDVAATTRELRDFSGKLNEGIDDFKGSFVGRLMGQGRDDEEEEQSHPREMNLRR